MLRCDACGDRLSRTVATRCACGRALHDGCEHYHAEVGCRERGDWWIGLQEF